MAEKIKPKRQISKPKNEIVEPEIIVEQDGKQIWENLLGILGVVIGLAGASGAFLWLFGRYKYLGFFNSTNFPFNSLVQIPNEDYLMEGRTSFVNFLIELLFIALIFYLARIVSVYYGERIFGRLRNQYIRLIITLAVSIGLISGGGYLLTQSIPVAITSFTGQNNGLVSIILLLIGIEIFPLSLKSVKPDENKILQDVISVFFRILTGLFLIAFLIIIHTNSSYAEGYKAGCQMVAKKNRPVIVYSRQPINLEKKTKIDNVYIYTDFFLVFVDEYNYYLYKDVDPDKLKPKSLFIINRDMIETVEVLQSPSTDKSIDYSKICQKIAQDQK